MKTALCSLVVMIAVGCIGPRFRNVGVSVPKELVEAYAEEHGISYEQAKREMPRPHPKLLREQGVPAK